MSRPDLPTPPRAVGSTELADGRRIGWAEFGDPDGDPVLWFPGTPGARSQIPHDLDAEAAARRLRIVTIERPGTGDSTDHLYDAVDRLRARRGGRRRRPGHRPVRGRRTVRRRPVRAGLRARAARPDDRRRGAGRGGPHPRCGHRHQLHAGAARHRRAARSDPATRRQGASASVFRVLGPYGRTVHRPVLPVRAGRPIRDARQARHQEPTRRRPRRRRATAPTSSRRSRTSSCSGGTGASSWATSPSRSRSGAAPAT